MGIGGHKSIAERVARAFVLSASGVARVNKAVARIAHLLWYIASVVALLARLRALGGGADPVVDEATVRQAVRALLEKGILPAIRTSEILGERRQAQQDCTICGARIGVGEMGFEAPSPAGAVLVVHRRCFDLWTQEAANRLAGDRKKAQAQES